MLLKIVLFVSGASLHGAQLNPDDPTKKPNPQPGTFTREAFIQEINSGFDIFNNNSYANVLEKLNQARAKFAQANGYHLPDQYANRLGQKQDGFHPFNPMNFLYDGDIVLTHEQVDSILKQAEQQLVASQANGRALILNFSVPSIQPMRWPPGTPIQYIFDNSLSKQRTNKLVIN